MSETREFYRIVRHNPPDAEDFNSNAAKGKPPPSDLPAELLRSWSAISAYDTEERAREVAFNRTHLVGHIAVLEIGADAELPYEAPGRVTFERTGDDGH